MKLAPSDLRGVAETLMPLAHRDDSQSRAFRDQIEYDWHTFESAVQRADIVARTQILDTLVGAFLRDHRGGLVVDMGVGLDTRFHRLDDGAAQWLDVDLPEVIALREQLGEPTNPRHALFAGSILDDAWLDEVRRRSPPAIMFVAEGLLPRFDEAEHRRIFATLAEGFPGEEIVFHTSAPSVVVRWGLAAGRDVEQLDARVRYVGEYSLLGRAATIVHARFV